MNTKHCSKCKQDLPTSEFHRKTYSKDGLQGYCKSCSKKAIAEHKQRPTRTVVRSGPKVIAKGSTSLLRIFFGPDRVPMTFAALGEHLGKSPRSLYRKWLDRGRPRRVKSEYFFSHEFLVRVRELEKIRLANLAWHTAEKVKNAKKKQPPKKASRLEGNAEWQALSDRERRV